MSLRFRCSARARRPLECSPTVPCRVRESCRGLRAHGASSITIAKASGLNYWVSACAGYDNRAFYAPQGDQVFMPSPRRFTEHLSEAREFASVTTILGCSSTLSGARALCPKRTATETRCSWRRRVETDARKILVLLFGLALRRAGCSCR
jgi:hypothetical protein